MLEYFKKLRLNVKVSLLGAGSVLITAVVLVVLAVWQSGQYNLLAQREVDALIDTDLDHITQGVYNLARTENEAVQKRVNYNLNVATHELNQTGEVSLSNEFVIWNATNQMSGKSQSISLPKMLVGGRWLGNNSQPDRETPIVDSVTRMVGETATIFQRMNKNGDMLRVATTVKDSSHKRAVGSFIPAMHPDGTPDPVIRSILRGETYHGRAFAVNEWYLTAYQPIYGSNGNLVGMLYVGIQQKTIESLLRKTIIETSVGKTGYVYVLSGSGQKRGHYVFSQKGGRDGEDVWEVKDSSGQKVIQEIVSKAVTLSSGELATVRYLWQNPGESRPRWKIARLAYYEPWDWVIGTSVYEDELQSYHAILGDGRSRMAGDMIFAGFIITILFGLFGIFIAWTIGRPVLQLKDAVDTIIQGDLDQVVDIQSRDEIGELATSFNVMTGRLKMTMEDLRRSEEKYRKIFENALEGLFQASIEGQLLSVNPAMSNILGYESPGELVAVAPDVQKQFFVYPDQLADFLSEIVKCGGIYSREVQLYRKDMQVIWVSISAGTVLDNDGATVLIDGFLSDITDRKKLEEQLRQSQKMEAIGQLAGGIAHDFNNILTVIAGYSELLRASTKPGDLAREHITHILAASERAANLTGSLLAFSRKQVMALVQADLNDIVQNVSKLLRRVIGEDIRLITNLSCEPVNVNVDVGQIGQILINLATNARDAMPNGGIIAVETSLLELDDSFVSAHGYGAPGSYALLTVTDSGTGMSEEVRSKIFDPFFTTKDIGKGTGLGLSIVYGIVKQHNGYINVYSEPGNGTLFRIYLPTITFQQKSELKPTPLLPPVGGTETILLVEDDQPVRSLIESILNKSGYNVILADDGQSAVELFGVNREKIKLVIMDIIMPRKNGAEAFVEIKQLSKDAKVLFCSGYTADFIKNRGELHEDAELILKPIMPMQLLRKVREMLDREV
ncbi:MAG: response regulator [Geobacter sp.]|nr:response regulator [Geobacter sp.]